MKGNLITIVLAIALSTFSNSYATELALEREITEIARARCASELKKGQHYETNILTNGDLEFKLLGKKGGDLVGTFVYNKREWEEQQKS